MQETAALPHEEPTMNRMASLFSFGLILAGACLPAAAAEGDKPTAPAAGTLMVVDATGKEHTLKAWKFLQGTRRLGWLAPAGEKPEGEKGKEPEKGEKPEGEKGPEALQLRAATSLTYVEGVLTLIPLDRLYSVEFDNEAQTMTARVAVPGKDEPLTLTGTTRYKGINKVTLEAEVDKGPLGVAEVKFVGGVPMGIRAIRFPEPKKPAAPAGGVSAVVVAEDGKEKTEYPVTDLQALYRRRSGAEERSPVLHFKKTLKIDVKLIAKIAVARGGEGASWHVTTKKGEVDERLTPLKTVTLGDQPATLEGLIGQAPAGYLLFPTSALVEVRFDSADKPADPGSE
jgi:hypothetical protein